MKLFNFSLLAVALVLFPSPRLNAQLLKPVDPNQKADIGDKSVKFGDAQLNTIARPTLDLPSAELSKGNLKLQDADTKNVTDLKSLDFSKKLLADAKVAVSPGIGFGEYGDAHVRFSLIENEERTRQALRGIRQMQQKDGWNVRPPKIAVKARAAESRARR